MDTNTISGDCTGAGSEGSGNNDFSSAGFTGGDFTVYSYRGAVNDVPYVFNGVPDESSLAVPESSTLVIFASGLAGLAGFAARRRRVALA